jgi:hypothetical protein
MMTHKEDDTDEIKSDCPYHIDHHSRIKRNEGDIQGIWKEVTAMRTWVICGMGALLLQVGIIILTKIIH